MFVSSRPSLVSRRGFGFLLLAVLAGSGCGHSARNLSLDPELARKSCTEFLDAWKAGKTVKDLLPAIVARDEDWEGGAELVAYEVLPDERSDGTNLHIPTRLTLKKPKGKETKTDVTYVVGTSPAVSVFRE